MAPDHAHHHDHSHHGHGHGHSHVEGLGDGRIVVAIVINALLTAAQIAGGLVSGSLALVADALHNLNDAASMGIALAARRIARKPADAQRTYGYRRAEIVGALINVTALILIGLYLLGEAVARFFNPEPVRGWLVVWVSVVAVVINVGTAVLLYAMSKGSMNIRTAFIHNVADALGSFGVIISGTLIIFFGWNWADLVAALVISGYILYQSIDIMRDSVRILMQSMPPGLEVGEVERAIASAPGVRSSHHIHVWQLDENSRALEAHVVIDRGDLGSIEAIKDQVKSRLAERFQIYHSTLEFEPSDGAHGHACPTGEACVH